jgi:hypothetical protein
MKVRLASPLDDGSGQETKASPRKALAAEGSHPKHLERPSLVIPGPCVLFRTPFLAICRLETQYPRNLATFAASKNRVSRITFI